MKKRMVAMIMSLALTASMLSPGSMSALAADSNDAAVTEFPDPVTAGDDDSSAETEPESESLPVDDPVYDGERQSTPESDFTWEGNIIKKFIGTGTDVIIPDRCEEIFADAFYKSAITSVIIPSGVKKIGEEAFRDSTNLKTLVIENPDLEVVYSIHPPFAGCPLTNITLPEEMTVLPNSIFGEVVFEKGAVIKLPSKITKIGAEAFVASKNLATVELPAGVTEIDHHAFCRSEITAITIPSKVRTIGNGAFSRCEKLETVNINSAELEYSGDGSDAIFKNCPIKNLSLPDGMQTLPKAIFAEAKFAEGISIDLPSSLTEIGDSAFLHSENLVNITLPAEITRIGYFAFSDTALTSITIPSKVKIIADGAFENCRKLETINIESAVLEETGFGNDPSFRNCVVSTIKLPDALTKLPRGIFSQVVFAEGFRIVLPKKLVTIETSAFSYSKNISCITFPVGLKTIDGNAFYECGEIPEVIYSGTEEQWEKVSIASGNDAILHPTQFLGAAEDDSPLGPKEPDLSQYTADENVIAVKSINLKKTYFADIKGIKKFVAASGDITAVKIKGSTMKVLTDGTVIIQAQNKKGEVLAEKEIEVVAPSVTVEGTQIINRRGTFDLNTLIRSSVQPESWKCSSKKIATVDEHGLLTINKSGTIKITAKFPTQKGMTVRSLTIKIKIQMPQFKKSSYSVKVGKTVKTAVKNAEPTEISYRVADTNIATVNEQGVVTGVSRGETKLIITVRDIDYETLIKVK